MKKKSVLIIGVIPPPIGGVTIHVKRLLENLKEKSNIFHYDPRKDSIFCLLKGLRYCKLVHIHLSNAVARFIFTLICKSLFKKIIFTYHGEFPRFSLILTCIEKVSMLLSDHVILLNNKSLSKVNLRHKISIISAYLPPIKAMSIREDRLLIIKNLKANHRFIFATNAFSLSYHLDNEVYGIFNLIEIFKGFEDRALIISDPSNMYSKYLETYKKIIPPNVTIFSGQHDFYPIIKLVDCILRCTSTDGDSLTIYEALEQKVDVIATDCVDRPQGCIIVPTNDWTKIKEKIKSFDGNDLIKLNYKETNSTNMILELYDSLR